MNRERAELHFVTQGDKALKIVLFAPAHDNSITFDVFVNGEGRLISNLRREDAEKLLMALDVVLSATEPESEAA